VWARSAPERIRGLLFKPQLEADDALILDPARQVHTFGMTAPIDVLFLDEDLRIVHIVHSMRPWRMTKWVREARYAIELASRSLTPEMHRGDRLRWSP
jgi:uncharacterized membrane protein (UPF0127 family)